MTVELIEGVNAKYCTKCGNLKGFEEFYKKKNGKYGLAPHCKICMKEYKKKWYEENKDRNLEKSRIYREANKEYYKKQCKKWYEENKDRALKQNKIYREKNKDKRREYYEKNKSYLLKQNKIYREKNKDKLREYYGNKHKENVNKYREYSRKRKALKLNAIGNFTEKEFKEISLEFFGWKCAYTGEPILKDLSNCHREHIIPLSKGGDNGIWNIVPSLDWVNLSKNNSDMEEWYRKQSYFSEERLNKIYEYMRIMEEKYFLKKCI